jgi:hypothetical protein
MSLSDEQKRQQYLSWLDQQIRLLIGDGDVSHLPNAGRKFDWSQESPHTPEDLRLAYKIMRDADVVPEWIALGAELEKERSTIERLAQQIHRDYLRRQAEADRRGSLVLKREAESRRADALQRLRDQIAEYNRKLLVFNLTRPQAVAQRVPLTVDEVMRAAKDAD